MPLQPNPFNSSTVTGEPYFTTPSVTKTKSNTRSNVANMLGKAAQAVMGPYQDNVVAQLGGLGAQLAQRKVYSDTVSRLLAGEDISNIDTRILDPEQITAAMNIKDQAVKSRLADSELRLRQAERIDKLNIAQDQKDIALRQIWSGEQIADKQIKSNENINAARITGEKEISADRNATTIKATEMETAAMTERAKIAAKNALDQIRASKDPKDLEALKYLTLFLSLDIPNVTAAATVLRSIGKNALAEALEGKDSTGMNVTGKDDFSLFAPPEAQDRVQKDNPFSF